MRVLILAVFAYLLATPSQATTRRSKIATADKPAASSGTAVATPATSAKLSDFGLGNQVLGTITLADAKGRGVVIEAWGVHCPPCIASLPHLQELSQKHKDKVVFFGAECQGSDKAAIEAVIKKAGVTYSIFSGLPTCPIQFSGIPHAFVFDGTGKMLFDGHPSDPAFTAAIEKAASTAKGGPLPTAPATPKTKA